MCTVSLVGWCTGGQELFKENLQSMHSPRSETGLKREIGAKKGAFKIWLAGQIAPAAVLGEHSQLFQRFFLFEIITWKWLQSFLEDSSSQ